MKNRTLIIALTIAVLGGLLFVVTRKPGQQENASELASVGIGTFSQAIDYAPFFIAKHFKWFESELQAVGVRTPPTYFELTSFDEIQAGFAKKALHAFFSAEAPATKLRSMKEDLRIVEVGCTLQQEILVRVATGITKVSALKGKRISVAEGTSSHYGLLKILSAAGLNDTDVTLVPGFPGDAKPRFESGDVDAWAVWPPFVEEQVIANRGITLPGGDARIQSVMSLHTSVLDGKPEVGKALVAAIQKSKRWLASNAEEAQAIIAKQLKLDVDVVKLAWPKHNWGATLTEDVLEDVKEKSKFLTEKKVVADGRVVTLDELVDKRFTR